MIVAADGTAYIGDMGTRSTPRALVRQAGSDLPRRTRRQRGGAADDLASPNGHVLTDDGRTLIIAESGGSA